MSESPLSSNETRRKRIATRACDACRTRRVKCDDGDDETGSQDCRQCSRSSRICQRSLPAPSDTRERAVRYRGKRKQRNDGPTEQETQPSKKPDQTVQQSQGLEPRYLGSTSLSTTVEVAIEAFHNRSRRELAGDHESTYFPIVLSLSGEQATLVAQDGEDAALDDPSMDEDMLDAFKLDTCNVAASIASQTVILALLQSFANNFLAVYPVISLAELCSLEPSLALTFPFTNLMSPPTALPDPLAKLTICSLAALSRKVPRRILHSLHHSLRQHMDSHNGNSLLRTSCLGNIQVLLLLGISSELHSRTVSVAGGCSWMMVGAAIRMAQNLGLHRDLTASSIPSHQLNRRRRIWGAIVTADCWFAISQGQPMTVNLADCDARAPSMYHDHAIDNGLQTEKPYRMHAEITNLSMILGRVLRCAYGPHGIALATDDMLLDVHTSLQAWQAGLPGPLRLDNEARDPSAGLLHMMYSCVNFAFLRLFLHTKKPIPVHISFRPPVDAWSDLVSQSGLAIEWCSREGSFFMDIWFLAHYTLTWCFLIQLHDYTNTGSYSSLLYLNQAVRCSQDWAASATGDPGWRRSLRFKIAGFISVLKDAAEQQRFTSAMPDMPPVTQEQPATDMFSLMPNSVFDGLDFDFLAQDTCEMFDWAAMDHGGLNS